MKIVIKQDSKKEYYANLIARNGKIVWKTPDGYKRIAGVWKALNLIAIVYDINNEVDAYIKGEWIKVIDETKKVK
jgi:uncharacterized protein YegP (UPF0339 family)